MTELTPTEKRKTIRERAEYLEAEKAKHHDAISHINEVALFHYKKLIDIVVEEDSLERAMLKLLGPRESDEYANRNCRGGSCGCQNKDEVDQ